MARKGFKPNPAGYRAVLLSGDARKACETAAASLSASASSQSGIDYSIDSMAGMNRIHTRVSTQTREDFFRERRLHALEIAVSSAGGNVTGGSRTGRRKR